jgi:ketosteroid isomerase-like protein
MTEVIERLVNAVNAYDLEGLVGCFAEDYKNETPVHPMRGFTGNEQVRKNWSQILGSIRDINAQVLREAVAGDLVWTEWDMSGKRPDGTPFLMRGVVIFGVGGGLIRSARFYLEPAEEESGDVDRHTNRVVTGR